VDLILKILMVLKRRGSKLILLFCLLIILFLSLYRFLAKTELVDSKVMVVEGWVTDNTLKKAAIEYKSKHYNLLITTGGPVLGKAFVLAYNSALRFMIADPNQSTTTGSTIEVIAFGRALDGEYPHFRLSLNDSLIGERYVSHTPRDIKFETLLSEDQIRSISVKFDNDGVSSNGDRNLAILGIRVNDRFFSPFSKTVSLVYGKPGNTEVQPVYENLAQKAAYFLQREGIEAEKIVAAPSPFVEIDRTYESALSIKKVLNKRFPTVRSLNIISEGAHSRRSWMMYKKALDDNFKIGVMAVEVDHIGAWNWWTTKKGIKFVSIQFAKYLYAQFFFYPFG
jgi:hypothetical protein